MMESVIDELNRQIVALPDDAILEIHVADPAGAAAISEQVRRLRLDGVEVIYTPRAR
jgi:hypothetical protein